MFVLFLVLWLYYCLLIYTTYQSELYSRLTYPGEYELIRTEEELNISGLGKYSCVKIDPIPVKMQYPYFKMKNALTYMYKYRNISVIGPSNIIDVELMHGFKDRGKPQIMKLQHPSAKTYMVIYSNLNYIISKRIHKIVKQHYYNGCFQHFTNIINALYHRNAAEAENEERYDQLSNLQSVFYLLLIGLLFAFVVFVFEIVYYNVKISNCIARYRLQKDRNK